MILDTHEAIDKSRPFHIFVCARVAMTVPIHRPFLCQQEFALTDLVETIEPKKWTGNTSPVFHPHLWVGKLIGNAPYARGAYAGQGRTECQNYPKLTTHGSLRDATEAFIYVGQRPDGVVKVGMSSNPQRRCRGLGIDLLFTVPVVVKAAKLVETYAFQRLGALAGDTEWVKQSPDRAIDAVCAAWSDAGRVAHVNPLLSADEARELRVRIAA